MTLDLSEIDPPVWRVLIENTAYGPYTFGQVQSYINEGRIGLHSKIAKGDNAAFVDAETLKELQPALRKKVLEQPKRRQGDQSGTPHNYTIISQLKGESETKLVQCLNAFGSFGEAMPGVYVLRSKAKLSTLQKGLKAATQSLDRVLIVNATMNKLGWFNLGPAADAHLRSIWDKDLD